MDKRRITKEGQTLLLNKLETLKIEKVEVLERLQIAREFGDLKENAEYNEAKSSLAKIENEIEEIKEILANSIVISEDNINKDFVGFGSTVTIQNIDTSEKKTYKIVGDAESDILSDLLSESSPIAKCMIGKKKNESFSLTNDRGTKTFKILKIE